MGKCKFNEAWLDKQSFSNLVDNNVFKAFCTVHKKRIQLGKMGLKALECHAKSSKHKNSVKGKEQTPSIAGVFQPAGTAADNVSQLAATVPEAEFICAQLFGPHQR